MIKGLEEKEKCLANKNEENKLRIDELLVEIEGLKR